MRVVPILRNDHGLGDQTYALNLSFVAKLSPFVALLERKPITCFSDSGSPGIHLRPKYDLERARPADLVDETRNCRDQQKERKRSQELMEHRVEPRVILKRLWFIRHRAR